MWRTHPRWTAINKLNGDLACPFCVSRRKCSSLYIFWMDTKEWDEFIRKMLKRRREERQAKKRELQEHVGVQDGPCLESPTQPPDRICLDYNFQRTSQNGGIWASWPKRDGWVTEGPASFPLSLTRNQEQKSIFARLGPRKQVLLRSTYFPLGTRGRKSRKEKNMGSCPYNRESLPWSKIIQCLCWLLTNRIFPLPLLSVVCPEVVGRAPAGLDDQQPPSPILGIQYEHLST